MSSPDVSDETNLTNIAKLRTVRSQGFVGKNFAPLNSPNRQYGSPRALHPHTNRLYKLAKDFPIKIG